jgi:hypothetical protein
MVIPPRERTYVKYLVSTPNVLFGCINAACLPPAPAIGVSLINLHPCSRAVPNGDGAGKSGSDLKKYVPHHFRETLWLFPWWNLNEQFKSRSPAVKYFSGYSCIYSAYSFIEMFSIYFLNFREKPGSRMLLFYLTGKAGQNGPRTALDKQVSALISQAFDRLNPPHTAVERTTLTPGAITASPSTKARLLVEPPPAGAGGS